MAKAVGKKTKPKKTDKKQFERFMETARNLGVEDSGEAFEKAFSKLVPAKTPKSTK